MGMLKETGSRESSIWLLGDSNPVHWYQVLATPFDPRHPARHNIWTPVMEVVQDELYRQARLRVDTSKLFIRNAIEDPVNKPAGTASAWSVHVLGDVQDFHGMLTRYKPIFVFSFGAFAYEFARRALSETPEYAHAYWGARRLGADFRERVAKFSPDMPNVFPLLHATIARGKFIESHNYFCDDNGANYFEYVGRQVASLFLANRERLNIWIG